MQNRMTYNDLLEFIDNELCKVDTTPNVPGAFMFNFPPYLVKTELESEIAHLIEEVAEFNSAVFEGMSDEDIICELMDVIHQCETIIRVAGKRKLADRCKSLVIQKNKCRGYYEPQA